MSRAPLVVETGPSTGLGEAPFRKRLVWGSFPNGKGPWRTLGEIRNIEGGGGEATLHWGSRVKDGFIARAPPKLRKDPEAGEGTVATVCPSVPSSSAIRFPRPLLNSFFSVNLLEFYTLVLSKAVPKGQRVLGVGWGGRCVAAWRELI